MIWEKITINTRVEAADIVASVLFDNGIVGVEIEDNQNLSPDELKKMYVDIPKYNIDDGNSKVIFYISFGEKNNNQFDNVDKNLIDNSYMQSNDNIFNADEFNTILHNVINELNEYKQSVDLGSLKIERAELDDKDFLNRWKDNFKSIEIGDINILPEWEKPRKDKINIFLEPGNAFGTGQHATTKLCLKSIYNIIKNTDKSISLLDIGTGSGILGIASYKLGADKVFAIDIDENCELNIIKNLQLNGINDYIKIDNNIKLDSLNNYKYIFGFGNIISDETIKKFANIIKYDIIVANILSPVIISLINIGNIQSYAKEDAYFVFSGIIKESEKDVMSTLQSKKCFYDIKCDYDGDWVSITCRNGV